MWEHVPAVSVSQGIGNHFLQNVAFRDGIPEKVKILKASSSEIWQNWMILSGNLPEIALDIAGRDSPYSFRDTFLWGCFGALCS